MGGLDRRGDVPCSWPSPGGWPRRRSCSRSLQSSTCRSSTKSTTRRSGGGSWRCCGGPPTRRALIGDYALVNALLTAALRLVDPADAATVVAVRTGRHAALFSLGRLDEADEEYRSIEELCPTALERADATAVQVRCLSHRTRFAEAIELGLAVAARVRHRRARRGRVLGRARRQVRPPPSLAGQHRPGRGSASPRALRPRAAGREPPDRCGPAAGLLRRRSAR